VAESLEALTAQLAYARTLASGASDLFLQTTEGLVAAARARARDARTHEAKVSDTRHLLGEALTLLGNALERAGRVPEAITTLEEAIGLARAARERDPEAGAWASFAYFRLGVCYDTLGDLPEALQALQRGLVLAEQHGDERALMSISNSLGVVYGRAEDHSASLERFEEVVATARRLGDLGREGSAQSNRSIALRHLGRIEEGLEAAKLAIEATDRHGDPSLRAAAQSNHAMALAAAGDIAAARVSFERARELQRAFGQPVMEAEHLRAHGEFLMDHGDLEEALTLFLESERIAAEADIPWLLMRVHQRLSDLYKRQRAFELALEHFERFHRLKVDQLRGEAVRELEAQKSRAEIAYTRLERDTLRARYEQLLRDHDALAGRAERLERDALVDDLTDLANRRAFDARWAESMALAHTTGLPCALLLIDLDHFKRVNDALGHAAGDAVLRHFGALLRAHVREADLAARLGGEEFAVLLTGSDRMHALDVAERLRANTAAAAWLQVPAEVAITVSIGVVASSEGSEDPVRLIEIADERLYRAKSAGRNRVIG